MNIRSLYCLFVIGFLTLVGMSCHKSKPSIAGGGKGGNAVLCLSPEAHGLYVDTCTYYIKYGTLDAPNNNIFDDSAQCVMVNGIPVATFLGLTNGSYYVLAKGLHIGYIPPTVKGGTPISVNSQDTEKVVTQLGAYNP